jgi:hypothetical protein
VAIKSTPFSGTMPRRETADFHTAPAILAPLILQGEIGGAGRVALQFGDLAAHADTAEVAFQRVLHRAADFRDRVFGDVGDRKGGEAVHGGRVGDRGVVGERVWCAGRSGANTSLSCLGVSVSDGEAAKAI